MRRGRRIRLSAGLACLAVAAVPAAVAVAADEPGSGLESFAMTADAPTLRVRQGTESTEAVVPQSLATLRNGGVGFAQSAVVWPGAFGGNAGSLLVLAAGAPQQATLLNSPVRAEARVDDGPPEVVNDDYPGTRMVASATAQQVQADSTLGDTSVLGAVDIGSARSAGRSALTGARTAVAEATSLVRDVSLLDGQVTIGAVTSSARATTDGARTTVEGRTVVSDLRVAGQRVAVGSDGLTVLGQAGPDSAPAVAAVNQVVNAANLSVAVGEPVAMQDAGDASMSAGSLVLAFRQSSGAVLSVILGGANVSVAAVSGTPSPPAPPAAPDRGEQPPPAVGAPAPEPVQFDIGTGGETVAAAPAPPAAPGSAPVAAPPAVAPVDLGPVQGVAFALPAALSLGWLALALLGSLLVASSLRRVPDALVAATPATSCPLSER